MTIFEEVSNLKEVLDMLKGIVTIAAADIMLAYRLSGVGKRKAYCRRLRLKKTVKMRGEHMKNVEKKKTCQKKIREEKPEYWSCKRKVKKKKKTNKRK